MPPRPLAVRLPNWLGDVCMALPALLDLQAAGFSLVCFGKRWAVDLLAACPWTTQALPKTTAAIIQALRASGCRQGLVCPNSLSSALTLRLAGIKALGFASDGRSLLLGQAVPKPDGRHEVEYFHLLAGAVHQRWRPRAPWPDRPGLLHLPLTPEHRRQGEEALRQAGLTPPFLVLGPGATGTIAGRSRVWPHWSALCRHLVQAGHRVAVFPGPGEESDFAARSPGALVIPGVGLGAYAHILGRSQAVVANDSGPMHLATAAGARVLGIHGLTPPVRTRAWGQQAVGDGHTWPDLPTVLAAVDHRLHTACV